MSFRFTTEHIAFFATEEFAQMRAEIAYEIIKYGDSPRLQTGLRKQYPHLEPALLGAVIEQLSLGPGIAAKTALPQGCIASRSLLEQASSASTARYHASLFSPSDHVLECCAGMGADTIAIARSVRRVTAVESDPVHAAILQHNIAAAGRTNVTVINGTAESVLHESGEYTAIFADPSRRARGKRTITPEEYSPPLPLFFGIETDIPVIVKTAPATSLGDAFDKTFVGAAGECKEQLVLQNHTSPPPLVAETDSMTTWTPGAAGRPTVSAWKYLIEPHNAVVASGEVRQYFYDAGCIPVDDAIAYGICDALPAQSALHTAFRVLKQIPSSMKALQAAVTELGFNRSTEIKKRGFPMSPEEVYKKLKFTDDGVRGTILLMRVGNGHTAVLAERIG